MKPETGVEDSGGIFLLSGCHAVPGSWVYTAYLLFKSVFLEPTLYKRPLSHSNIFPSSPSFIYLRHHNNQAYYTDRAQPARAAFALMQRGLSSESFTRSSGSTSYLDSKDGPCAMFRTNILGESPPEVHYTWNLGEVRHSKRTEITESHGGSVPCLGGWGRCREGRAHFFHQERPFIHCLV